MNLKLNPGPAAAVERDLAPPESVLLLRPLLGVRRARRGAGGRGDRMPGEPFLPSRSNDLVAVISGGLDDLSHEHGLAEARVMCEPLLDGAGAEPCPGT